MSDSTAAIILAAGRSTRFGANKLLADFRGLPMLQHALDLAAAAKLTPVVVVVGPDHTGLKTGLTWSGQQIVVNESPDRGISGSVQVGMRELAASHATRAVVLLGDQPTLNIDQLNSLIEAPVEVGRPIVVPRYGGRPGNPVLLERPAWPLADELRGDLGMVQVIGVRPELVRYLDVLGSNPDVDTRADLDTLRG